VVATRSLAPRGLIRAVTVLVVLSGVAASTTSAEDYGVAQTYIHSFSNNVSVYTGVFALNKDVSLETTTYFRYTVDFVNPSFSLFGEGGEGGEGGDREADSAKARAVAAVSSASAAAGTGASDVRNELMAGFTHQFGNAFGLEMYYDYSKESDYTSNTPIVTLKKDLFEKNTTLTLSFSENFDQVYGQFMSATEPRNTSNYYFGITQLLSPVDFFRIGYSGSRMSGFTSEGTRLVPISPATAADCTEVVPGSCVTENFPDFRLRNAYLINVNHYFEGGWMDRSSVQLGYRYYQDSWSIRSNTEEVEYYKYLGPQLLLGLNYRFYNQSQAYFVKDVYTASDTYYSASPQLEKFSSQLAGIMLSYTIPRMFSFATDGAIEGRYEYYTQTINTTGQTIMLGLRFRF